MRTRMSCLLAGALVWTTTAAGQAPVAKYDFENNVLDSVGSAHGTITGTPSYVAGR